MCLFKSQTHVLKYRKFQLSADIEKNPGPTPIYIVYIDSCKTITASYSQANELVFRQNSGQQSVAMSLFALWFTITNKEAIILLNDPRSLMNIGNQLYPSFSQVTRRCFSFAYRIIPVLNVFNTDCDLKII